MKRKEKDKRKEQKQMNNQTKEKLIMLLVCFVCPGVALLQVHRVLVPGEAAVLQLLRRDHVPEVSLVDLGDSKNFRLDSIRRIAKHRKTAQTKSFEEQRI